MGLSDSEDFWRDLEPGESWDLESVIVGTCDRLCQAPMRAHPPLPPPNPPTPPHLPLAARRADTWLQFSELLTQNMTYFCEHLTCPRP